MTDETRFWKLIDASRRDALGRKRRRGEDLLDVHMKALTEALRGLPPAEVVDFQERFWEVHGRAYRWDLWAAAYWLCGGCGNDGFTDFRACLISLGREAYRRILADPDALADVAGRPDAPYMQGEGFQYVAPRVYRELTGRDMPEPAGPAPGPAKPAGKRIDPEDKDVMRRRFPRLVAKYPNMGH
jgi:hypothetical protein